MNSKLPLKAPTISSRWLLVGTLIIPAAYAETRTEAVLLFTGSTSGLGLATANIWVITQTLAPRIQLGIWSAIQNVGGAIGTVLVPLVTGLLADATGSFVAPLVLAGAISTLGILCYWLLIRESGHLQRG